MRFSHWFIHPHIRQPHIPPTCTKKVSPPARSKVDLLKAWPNDVCHGRGAKCHHHMWGWLQEVVHSCRGPQDFERWVLGTQLGHRGREFPEAFVWSYSAEAPSWPGHANLGVQWNVGLMGVVLSVFFKTALTLSFRCFRAKTNKFKTEWLVNTCGLTWNLFFPTGPLSGCCFHTKCFSSAVRKQMFNHETMWLLLAQQIVSTGFCCQKKEKRNVPVS